MSVSSLRGHTAGRFDPAKRRISTVNYSASYAPPSARVQSLIYRRPAQLVVLGFATVVARLHELVPGMSYVHPVVLLAIALTISTSGVNRRIGNSIVPADDTGLRLMLTYWFWMAVTVPSSILRGGSLQLVLDLTSVMIFAAMIIAQPKSFAQLRYITRGYMVVCTIYAIALGTMGQALMDGDAMRYYLTGSLDPNDAAAILAIGAPMALADFRRPGSKLWRVTCLAMLAIMCLGILKTGSRGGAIAAFVGLLAIVLSSRGTRAIIATVLLGATLMLVKEYAPPEIAGRFATIGSESDDYNMTAYSGRWQIWKRGLNYIAENPVLGVGAGAFPIREGEQMAADGLHGKWSAAHNAYIQSFAELGIVGGLLFCSLIISSILRLKSVFRHPSAVTGVTHPEYAAAMLAFATSAIFLSHAYFWGLFALVATCSLAARTLTAHGRSPEQSVLSRR